MESIEEHVFLKDLDQGAMMRLCGPLEGNLATLGEAFDVRVSRRGAHFLIEGADARIARKALLRLAEQAERGEIGGSDVHLAAVEAKSGRSDGAGKSPGLKIRKGAPVRARTRGQEEYLKAIAENDCVFGIGPAGTGKTYLAVAAAVDAVNRDSVERVVLVRPAVEAGEKLGFLPGDLTQKVDPYLRPLYDALFDLMGFDRVSRNLEKGVIEIAPLAYMRGRTLNSSFVILDEAQNTTPEQMKMFLTRIGFGSKAVITGDLTQVDLPRAVKSGLRDARDKLQGIPGLRFHRFTSQDVVRHPMVQRIVDAYDRWDAEHPDGESRWGG